MFNSDSFVEQAIRTKADVTYFFKVFVSLLFVVFGVFILLFISPVGMLSILIGICLYFYFSGDSNMEYEYTLTNGSVDIAVIYNSSKRKEKKHFSLDQVTMVVPKDSKRIEHERFTKTFDYTSKKDTASVIALVLEEKENKQLILMEPNEKTMQHIRAYAKNKIYDI